ncbi:MAG TPA: GMC family oxidoreductase [Candidatus Binatia bacterium]|jgi:choline dehydrogenase-like flavoprotein
MLVDAAKLSSDSTLSFEICILGAGAAGISLARELAKHSFNVGLVESGGFDPDRAQQLYDGETAGSIPSDLRYLLTSRMRWFGGTTNIWTGWCRPLDELDFQTRPWVDNSGWPISRADLDPFYERATQFVEVDSFLYTPEQSALEKSANWLRSDANLRSRFFHFSPPTRFGTLYRPELVSSSNVTLLLHANIVSLEVDGDGRRVNRVIASGLNGPSFTIEAKFFVLACGGIENARLLLTSNSVLKNGIGNQNDLVGRFFMDHPHVTRAKALFWPGDEILGIFEGKTENRLFRNRVRAVLSPTEQLQRQKKLLNFSLVIDKKIKMTDARASLADDFWQLDRARTSDIPPRAQASEREIEIRIEQAPDPENRVVLGSNLDSLGMRRAKLIWRMNELDLHTIEEAFKVIALDLGASASGRVKGLNGSYTEPTRFFDRNTPFDGDRDAQLVLWHHHMGTTRMHSSQRQGVVDANCQVHGMANLFIAGSSVFPTCGSANPTLTIIALALRLADHLSLKAK